MFLKALDFFFICLTCNFEICIFSLEFIEDIIHLFEKEIKRWQSSAENSVVLQVFFNSFRIYSIEIGEITVLRTKPGLLVFITYEQVLTSGTLAFCCKVVTMSVIGRLLLVHCIVCI